MKWKSIFTHGKEVSSVRIYWMTAVAIAVALIQTIFATTKSISSHEIVSLLSFNVTVLCGSLCSMLFISLITFFRSFNVFGLFSHTHTHTQRELSIGDRPFLFLLNEMKKGHPSMADSNNETKIKPIRTERTNAQTKR